MDVIPARAGPGAALRHVLNRFSIPCPSAAALEQQQPGQPLPQPRAEAVPVVVATQGPHNASLLEVATHAITRSSSSSQPPPPPQPPGKGRSSGSGQAGGHRPEQHAPVEVATRARGADGVVEGLAALGLL